MAMILLCSSHLSGAADIAVIPGMSDAACGEHVVGSEIDASDNSDDQTMLRMREEHLNRLSDMLGRKMHCRNPLSGKDG